MSARDGMSLPRGIPVYVMLPLDTVNAEGSFRYASSAWFSQALHSLAASGVNGVAVDAWWGAVEKEPREYNWSGYKQLMETIKGTGLKVQVVLSFHACGGNVGDSVQIPLPAWVLQCGEKDPDLFFTDRPREGSMGHRNREYISVWADDAPTLCGRTPMQCYEDLIISFRDNLSQELGTLIEEVVVGAGPCGELRFPSYVEANGWRFPGVGEFQCYDRRALASLAQAAREAGYPEWGNGGPHDSGDYSSCPEESGFFSFEGSWDTSYGRFFLDWYSGSLLRHGSRVLQAASNALAGRLHPHKPINSSSMASGDANVPPPSTSGMPPPSTSTQPAHDPVSHHLRPALHAQHQSHLNAMDADDSLQERGSEATASQAGSANRAASEAAATRTPTAATAAEATGTADRANRETTEAGSTEPSHGGELNLCRDSVDGWAAGVSGLPIGHDCASECMTPGPSHALESSASVAAAKSRQRSCMEAQQASGSGGGGLSITLKIAGIHWWFRSRSHAAELTAGYYNTASHDGYAAIVELCAKFGANLTLTCVEMCDTQHPSAALCGPEGLLKQVRGLCATRSVPLSGENALPIFQTDSLDAVALERIVFNMRAWHGAAAMSAYFAHGILRHPTAPDCLPEMGTPPSPIPSPSHASQQQYGLSGKQFSGSFPATSGFSRHTYYLGNTPTLQVGAQEGSRHSFSCEASPSGGGSRNSFKAFPPVRSDPAIAATGLRADSYANISEPLPPMRSFTLLRLCPDLLQPSFQGPWLRFMARMQQGGFL